MKKFLPGELCRKKSCAFAVKVFLALAVLLLPVHAAAQNVKVSIDVQNAPFSVVVRALEKASGYMFIYEDAMVAGVPPRTLAYRDAELGQVLRDYLKETGLSFRISQKNVVITKASAGQSAVERKVNGRVVSTANHPIAGVSVTVKGSGRGTVTDQSGEFSLEASDGDILEFRFLGMKTEEVPVTGQSPLAVTMHEQAAAIDEVVVNGIFTRKAESFTGSIVTLQGEDLQRTGNSNIFQSLKNLNPSLMNIDNMDMGSNPNVMPELQLRGTSSFPGTTTSELKGNYQNNPNQPLFILDGFPVSVEKVFDMDMNRVESLTILKDASAKAIYGSRAANGVVVIETKRLTANEVVVYYSGSVDITAPDLTSYNLCNALEKLEIERIEGFYETSHMPDVIKKQNIYNQRLRDAKEGLNTEWIKKPVQTGVGTKHSLMVEMGSDKVKGSATLSYNNVKGVMKKSGRNTIDASMSLLYRTKAIQFRNVMEITNTQAEDSPYGSFSEYAAMNPYHRDRDENGQITRYAEIAQTGGYTFNQKFTNPLYNATLGTSFTSSYIEFRDNFYAEANFNPYLKLTARFSVTSKTNKADSFYPADHTRFESYSEEDKYRRGQYILNNGSMNTLDGDIYLNWNREYGKHLVMVNVGGNIGQSKYQENYHTAEGFPSDKMNNILFARQYAKDSKPMGSESTVRDIGLLAVASYSYDNRLLLDATVRRSASSQFGENNRWGLFWSVGLGYNLHNMDFFSRIDGLSMLKIRGSVGTTGNQNVASYQQIVTYNYYMDKMYNNFLGVYLQGMANSDLAWERKLDYNIGLDVVYKWMNLKFDYYLAYTENLLTDISLPTSNGFGSVKENLGKVRNRGLDVMLTVTPYRSREGFLNLTFGITTNDNKIIKISDALQKYNDDRRGDASNTQQNRPLPIYENGSSMNGIWAVQSLGIDPASGNEKFLKRDGTTTFVWDAVDMICAGNSMPKFNGNFGLNGEYRGFGLSVVFRFLGGGQMYNTTLVDKIENIDISRNVDRRLLSARWTKEGDQKHFKRLGLDRTQPMVDGTFPEEKTRATTRFVQDRNELDLGSLSVYYDFPRAWCQKVKLERIKLSFLMNDVYKWSSMGVERGTTYPFARTMSLKLNVVF